MRQILLQGAEHKRVELQLKVLIAFGLVIFLRVYAEPIGTSHLHVSIGGASKLLFWGNSYPLAILVLRHNKTWNSQNERKKTRVEAKHIPLITKAQTPIYAGSYCQNTTQPPLSSAYQTNLNRIVTWMSSDAATSKGYNYTSIGNNSPAYGLYDCHSDVVGYFCQLCVSTAAREVRLRCPNRISAVVWYDSCILRKATVETNQLYYMEGFNVSSSQRRYGWVQCSRDLSNEGCRQCLEAMPKVVVDVVASPHSGVLETITTVAFEGMVGSALVVTIAALLAVVGEVVSRHNHYPPS
ncbi:hypothetical protein JHK82_043481 [Glycine max]|nr:hypothetical protein JHK82_043481 [Glycine max]